eukprot:scaffold227463_cov35-Tisochrysis_lutea.AAC.1
MRVRRNVTVEAIGHARVARPAADPQVMHILNVVLARHGRLTARKLEKRPLLGLSSPVLLGLPRLVSSVALLVDVGTGAVVGAGATWDIPGTEDWSEAAPAAGIQRIVAWAFLGLAFLEQQESLRALGAVAIVRQTVGLVQVVLVDGPKKAALARRDVLVGAHGGLLAYEPLARTLDFRTLAVADTRAGHSPAAHSRPAA